MKIYSNKNNTPDKREITAAESYGWVVENNEVDEAYDMACESFGKDYVDDAIIRTLSTDDIASSLAYLFRMWDFREWDERNDDVLDDEE